MCSRYVKEQFFYVMYSLVCSVILNYIFLIGIKPFNLDSSHKTFLQCRDFIIHLDLFNANNVIVSQFFNA